MSEVAQSVKKTVQMYSVKPVKDLSYLRCETCHKVFSRTWLLKNHQRVHTGERPYKCTFCDKAFADKSNLRQHMKIHTTVEKLFQCGICDRTFAQRRYLAKHVSEIHQKSTLPIFGVPLKRKKSHEIKADVGKPAPETLPDVITKVTDHQTRQKTKQAAAESTSSPKKYSEQDLKDFIKSSQKTMEKNGFIFIKQNFDMFDGPEPTLTEISDSDEQAKVESTNAGVQSDILAKQIVQIVDSGKTVRVSNKSDGSKAILQYLQNSKLKANGADIVSGEGKGAAGRKVNILGSKKRQSLLNQSNNKTILTGVNGQFVLSKSAAVTAKPLQNPIASSPPFTVRTMPSPVGKQATMQLVQLVHGGVIPLANNGPLQILPLQTGLPTSLLQSTAVLAPTGVKAEPVTITTPVSVGQSESEIKLEEGNFSLSSTLNTQVMESHDGQTFVTKVLPIDERGDSGQSYGVAGQQTLNVTPVVSDAPWQGVLNINSEQELLEYINSQSSSGEENKNFTIFIQNVDTPGRDTTPLTLDSHMLTGISGLGEGLVDQGLIMSDVLPVVSNVEEVHLNTDNSVTMNNDLELLSDRDGDTDIPIKSEADLQQSNENTAVFSSHEMPSEGLSMGCNSILEVKELTVNNSIEQSTHKEIEDNVHIKVSITEANEQSEFSNCETDNFSEEVHLLAPTMEDVNANVELVEGSEAMDIGREGTEEAENGRRGLYTDHDFYSVPMTDVDHSEDTGQTHSQCYNETVMLSTEEVTLEDTEEP